MIVPKSVAVDVNQELKYLQDIVDTDNLISVYNFQGNVEDEGGYGHDGTASNITYGTDSLGVESQLYSMEHQWKCKYNS